MTETDQPGARVDSQGLPGTTQDVSTTLSSKPHLSFFGPWMALPLYALFCPIVAVLVWFSPPGFENEIGGVFLASLFSFASLLGIWVILGRGSLRQRLAWAAGGLLYCTAVYALPAQLLLRDRFDSTEFLFMLLVFSAPAVGIAVVVLLAQRLGVRLTSLGAISLEQRKEAFQFSLRSLMGVVVAVAVLLAFGRSSEVYEIDSRFEIVFAAVVGVLAIYLALAAVWAALGLRRPLFPAVGLVLVAACLGLAVGSFGSSPGPFLCATFAATEAAGIIGPLLIVRWYGYRLVRLPSQLPGNEVRAGEIG